ncbi:DC1, C1-like, Zinc finger, RING/FYVE/PHD-type [Artemisia annua]|uniref:DC1, C1-like, Zinc finger, RING/FYVE/PHD-type n=1 Tax=Artemisia annua TaxID=35608 RepID=A0A2U1L2R3_ARTAN|nr:DC1, C1-like, Zinc finger, RING/FYVE/PHD-type [Artemisia annua]
MDFKEVQLQEIQHEHPFNLIDLQFMHQGYVEDDDDFEDKDLITVQKFKCTCDRCGLEIDWFNRYYYKCSNISCNYSLHKFCAELSTTLQSPAHPAHILILKKRTTHWQCSACLTDHQDGLCYHCSMCNYELDLRCATFLEQKTIHHPAHPHPLISVTADPISIKCFACGKKHKGDFYHCTTCLNFSIYSDCLSLPIKLLVESHRSHMLTLSYSFLDQVYDFECRICREEIYQEYWLYKCSKCMFYVHVECAIKYQQLCIYDEQEYENKNSVFSESKIIFSEYYGRQFMHCPLSEESYNILPHHIPKHRSSFFFDESTKENCYIKHFSHQHPLVLIHNQSNLDTLGVKLVPLHDPMKRVKLLCNGCVRPVTSMPFYKCSQDYAECSNFILHEWCARLRPEISYSDNYHSGNRKYVLRQSSLFSCKICGLPCNGFAYISDNFGQIDIHCSHRPHNIEHEAIPKLKLLLGQVTKDHTACGACRYIIKKGDFSYVTHNDYYLHISCALFLPKTIRHKYDKHPLKLSYTPVENYKGIYFCEVCEEVLDPTKWFYHCSECSQSIHPDCAPLILKSEQGVNSTHDDLVYKFINMKFGDVRDTEDHDHPVSFVAGTKIDGDCTKCGIELQSKFILKCLRCKFAIHSYCESSITTSEKQELVEMFDNLEKKREPKRKPRPPRVLTFYPKIIMRPVVGEYSFLDDDGSDDGSDGW